MLLCCVACAEQAANAQYSKDTELVARYCVDAQTIKQAKPLVQTILAAKRAVKAILGDIQLKIPQTRRQELEAQIVVSTSPLLLRVYAYLQGGVG